MKRWHTITEEKDHEIFVSIVGGEARQGKAREKNVLVRNRLVPALTYTKEGIAHSDQQHILYGDTLTNLA